jgi:hypothetical protein
MAAPSGRGSVSCCECEFASLNRAREQAHRFASSWKRATSGANNRDNNSGRSSEEQPSTRVRTAVSPSILHASDNARRQDTNIRLPTRTLDQGIEAHTEPPVREAAARHSSRMLDPLRPRHLQQPRQKANCRPAREERIILFSCFPAPDFPDGRTDPRFTCPVQQMRDWKHISKCFRPTFRRG